MALWFGLVCATALLAYARSFGTPFQFDDYNVVVGNAALRLSSRHAFLAFGRTRLVPFATLALNYAVGGENPFGYHVVNFAVHLAATFAVFRLALALCRTPRLRGTRLAAEPLPFAVAAAFLFAVHPIQIQAVTYVVQRMTAMAALFYVGSVLLYVRARNAQLGLDTGRPGLAYAGAAGFALAAFFSKENTASLPLAILLTEWVFYPGTRPARAALRLLPFVALVLVIPVTWKLFGTRPGPAPDPTRPLSRQAADLVSLLFFRASPRGQVTPLEYLLTQCLVIPRYLRMVVLPWGFNIDHDVAAVTDIGGAVLAGAAFLIGLLALGLYAVRRWPVVGFGVLWVFVALSVESSLLPIRDPMVEHRMYLPMAGVALAGGYVFAVALWRRRVAALAAATAVVLVLAALTFARNEVWRNPLALWQDALAKSPGKARVLGNVGAALHLEGRWKEAIPLYCKALALDPNDKRLKANLEIVAEELMEEESDDGEPIEAVMGPDGSLQLRPPDPCAAH